MGLVQVFLREAAAAAAVAAAAAAAAAVQVYVFLARDLFQLHQLLRAEFELVQVALREVYAFLARDFFQLHQLLVRLVQALLAPPVVED